MAVRRSSSTKGQGVHAEPAFVLHRYDWSESSLILELFTRHLGRVTAIAKGVRKPASSFRSVLLPFQPLSVSLSANAQIRTLRGAEWVGGYAMPTGLPLLVGFYLNELIMRLLARDDVNTDVFDAYSQILTVVAKTQAELSVEPALRAFELLLLQAIGVLPELDRDSLTLETLEDEKRYTLDPENGLIPVVTANFNTKEKVIVRSQASLPGKSWQLISQAMNENLSPELLQKIIEQVDYGELKNNLRILLSYHTGGGVLKTRQMMKNIQKELKNIGF